MKKYTGKYRVLGEIAWDNKNTPHITTNTYIPCYSNIQIYRYDRTKLVIQCPNTQSFNSRRKVLKNKKIWFEDWGYDDGGDIIFKEKDFEQLLKLKVGKSKFIRPNTKGKNIKYNDKSNLPKN